MRKLCVRAAVLGGGIGVACGAAFLMVFHAIDPFYHEMCDARRAFWTAVVPGTLLICMALGALVGGAMCLVGRIDKGPHR
jgi:hypothetical protein